MLGVIGAPWVFPDVTRCPISLQAPIGLSAYRLTRHAAHTAKDSNLPIIHTTLATTDPKVLNLLTQWIGEQMAK